MVERMPQEVAHSDTEVGRCIWAHSNGTLCTYPSTRFKAIYYGKRDGVVIARSLKENGRMELTFPRDPPTSYFASPILHPIKSASSVYLFHKQSVHNLRPVLHAVHSYHADNRTLMDDKAHQDTWKSAISEQNMSCTNNPELQFSLYGVSLKECETPPLISNDKSMVSSIKMLDILLITTQPPIPRSFENGKGSDLDHTVLGQALLSCNVSANITFLSFPASTLLHNAIEYAQTHQLPRVLILHSDVRTTPQLSIKLPQLFARARCGGSLWTENQGGMLMLSHRSSTATSVSYAECSNLAKMDEVADLSAVFIHSALYKDLLHSASPINMKTLLELSVAGYAIRWAIEPLFESTSGTSQ